MYVRNENPLNLCSIFCVRRNIILCPACQNWAKNFISSRKIPYTWIKFYWTDFLYVYLFILQEFGIDIVNQIETLELD